MRNKKQALIPEISLDNVTPLDWEDVNISDYEQGSLEISSAVQQLNYQVFSSFVDSIDFFRACYIQQFGVYPSVITIRPGNIVLSQFIYDVFYTFATNINYITRTEEFATTFQFKLLIQLDHHGLWLEGEDDEIINIYYNQYFLSRNDLFSKLQQLLRVLKGYEYEEEKQNYIHIIQRDSSGFDTTAFPVRDYEVDIQKHYNDDFANVNQRIIQKICDNYSGLFILNGEPGTGKTTYLRYLVRHINRKVIFVPPDMTSVITDPSFLPFLFDHPDSVLIIEDAESVLQKRDNIRHNGNISNILNVTDGLLSDCLNISIIATFNVDMQKIDEALLRPGRLLESYRFDKLSVKKAQYLMNELYNHNITVTKPMSLGEIYYYNIENNSEHFDSPVMGF